MSLTHLKKIVIVGAGGNIGSFALKHLLAADAFDITVLSRASSSTVFPSHAPLTIKRGDYNDPAFLSSVFTGQDAAMFALNFMAMSDQTRLIDAAAAAGVKWILPTEYAGDGQNEGMMKAVPLFGPKIAARKQIEALSEKYEGLKWVAVATNPWLEFSLQRGLFGFNAAARTATLYSDSGSWNSTTLPQGGLGIARLLSLPITNPSNPRASLSHYANNFVYLSSCLISQPALFASLQRATKTTEADWKIEKSTIEEWIGINREKMKGGDMRAGAALTYAFYMGEGKGGNYEEKAKADREVLGLEAEDLDEIVMRAVEEGEKGKVF